MQTLSRNPSLGRSNPLVRYGFAVTVSVVAVTITASEPYLHGIPFALSFVAISAAAWFGGFYAGLLSTMISILLVNFLVFQPVNKFSLHKPDLIQSAILTAAALFICAVARQRELKEKSQRKSEQLFRSLVESISEGFESFDKEWRFTYINVHGAAMSGHTPEQLIGRNHWEVFPDARGTKFEAAMKLAMVERRIARVTEYFAPLGKWFQLTAYPAQEGVSALFQDVTEQVEGQERLRVADRLATAGRLAATVSHEINNPLEAIGNLLFLLQRSASFDEARNYAAEAERQLYRASHIAKQTLSFYRAASEASEVLVSSAVSDAASLFAGRFEGRNIRFLQRIEEGLAVFISPGEFVQVIANLLSNALDVAPSDSEILLEAAREHNSAVIRVIDSGGGIPLAIHRKIFDPFFTTKKDFGTGLGLWVSRSIVEKHKGTITARNREGEARGAIFTITLPLAQVREKVSHG